MASTLTPSWRRASINFSKSSTALEYALHAAGYDIILTEEEIFNKFFSLLERHYVEVSRSAVEVSCANCERMLVAPTSATVNNAILLLVHLYSKAAYIR